MQVAIIGGGVNGLCCAWTIARENHQVTLFEKGQLMQQTSRASSKLLHGGLRYLENGEFRLVREALHERDAWIERVPKYAHPLKIVIPVYRTSRRGRWIIGAGLYLYKLLAGRSLYSGFKWLSAKDILERDDGLDGSNLIGGYEFYDGQMDDYQLGLWIAEQARTAGVDIREETEITSVTVDGEVTDEHGNSRRFDRVINVAGPWAKQLANQSNNKIPYELDLVRGSHLVIAGKCKQAYLLEVPDEARIIFVLPWKGDTLIGTTEVRQETKDPIECSQEEENYLLDIYNTYKTKKISADDIIDRFSGVRPLIKSDKNPSRATREYVVHRNNKLITVLGGKWTTSLALANQVNKTIQ